MEEVLLVERNKVMASRAIELLRTNPGSSLFFAFGADHFEGDDSVIDLMREAGFEVERVRVSTDLDTLRPPQSIAAEIVDSILLLVSVLTFILLYVFLYT